MTPPKRDYGISVEMCNLLSVLRDQRIPVIVGIPPSRILLILSLMIKIKQRVCDYTRLIAKFRSSLVKIIVEEFFPV